MSGISAIYDRRGGPALPGLIAATTAAGATVRAMSNSAPVSEVVARLIREDGES